MASLTSSSANYAFVQHFAGHGGNGAHGLFPAVVIHDFDIMTSLTRQTLSASERHKTVLQRI